MPKRKRQKKWSFEEWQSRERRKKTQELIGKRRKQNAEKNAAAITVFALREPLRAFIHDLHDKAAETKTLTKRNPDIDLLDVVTRAPQHQDAIAKLISETPSVMLFLEFLISQKAAASRNKTVFRSDRDHFFQVVIEEVCVLVEGYQRGLQQGLDVGQHIMGIPNDEKDAAALWNRLGGEEPEDDSEEEPKDDSEEADVKKAG